MNKINVQFSGSIPEAYDKYLGPLLFEFSAKDTASRIESNIPAGGKMLEIACGTGISTYYIRNSLVGDIHITATDVNPAMLDYAKSKHGDLDGVTFEVADALSLPYEDNSFDAVVCQFGIMFFPDKLKGLQEMHRVLKPGGTLYLTVWDKIEKNESALIIYFSIEKFFESNPPQFTKIPFSFNDIESIKEIFSNAGFKNCNHNIVAETVKGIPAIDVARGWITGSPNIIEINERAVASTEEIIKSVSDAIIEKLGPEPIAFDLQEIIFTAKKD